MSTFAENQWFDIQTCCNCHMTFAMTASFEAACRKDHRTFYCPAGHGQHYTGPTPEQRLKNELKQKQQEIERKQQMLDAAQAKAATAEADRQQITKAHLKMRDRVMNGVCPCCNRTFQNLMQHMRSEHPDFGATKTLFALRQAFGMTQAQVAKEAGTEPVYVSLYERDKRVPERAKTRLDGWLERHHAAPAETSAVGANERGATDV